MASFFLYTQVMSSSGFVLIVDMLIASSKTLEGIIYRPIFRIPYQMPPTNIIAKTTAPVTLNPMTRPLLTTTRGEEGKVVFAIVLFVIAGEVFTNVFAVTVPADDE